MEGVLDKLSQEEEVRRGGVGDRQDALDWQEVREMFKLTESDKAIVERARASVNSCISTAGKIDMVQYAAKLRKEEGGLEGTLDSVKLPEITVNVTLYVCL